MIYLLLRLLFVIALGTFCIKLFYQLISNFQPSGNKIVDDLKSLKKEVAEWPKNLVPWSKEEMELLSFEQMHQEIKKGLSKSAKGIFTSVYHEPLLIYNYKQYLSRGVNALLYARTSKHEFAYRINKKEVIISIDNEYAGVLKENGQFFGGEKNNLIAEINRDDTLDLHPVKIGTKEVGRVVNPNKAAVPNPRAFKLVGPLEEKEEEVFLSLAILEMVTESFNK